MRLTEVARKLRDANQVAEAMTLSIMSDPVAA